MMRNGCLGHLVEVWTPWWDVKVRERLNLKSLWHLKPRYMYFDAYHKMNSKLVKLPLHCHIAWGLVVMVRLCRLLTPDSSFGRTLDHRFRELGFKSQSCPSCFLPTHYIPVVEFYASFTYCTNLTLNYF